MPEFAKIITFIGVQTLLGKRASFPYGLLVGLNLFEITALVVANDMIQTFVLLNCFGYLKSKFPMFKTKERAKKRWKEKIETWGFPGVIAVSALPYGGGALTGSILAISTNLNKIRAYWSIVAGCIIGSLLFCAGFGGILNLFQKI